MAGVRHWVYKTHEKCQICGKTDYCKWYDYGEDGILRYCGRVHDDTVIGLDGTEYYRKRDVDDYSVYESVEQREDHRRKWIEEQKALNPNFRGSASSGRSSYRKPAAAVKRKETVKEPYTPVAEPKRLHTVYSTFLSLLVLEPWDRDKLISEWDVGIDKQLSVKLFKQWPIKSIPPNDFIKYRGQKLHTNKSRKEIMGKLVKMVGEPIGVPGFYQKEDGVWTFSALSGCTFPVYNSCGQIIRLVVKDEYPVVDTEKGYYQYRAQGDVCGWYFSDDDGKTFRQADVEAYSMPKGKVNGKYKKFTSYSEEVVETEDKIIVRNRRKGGTFAGSVLSLYVKAGDDITTCLVTEGEKKAMVLNMVFGCPVICIPGVGQYNLLVQNQEGYNFSILQHLKKNGMKQVMLVYDADKHQNKNVDRSEKEACKLLAENGYDLLIGDWQGFYGKGADDAAIMGVRPRPSKYVYVEE